MDRILANCHFYSIHELKSDPGLPIQSLAIYIKNYLELEESQPEDIEDMLLNSRGCNATILDLACQAGGCEENSSTGRTSNVLGEVIDHRLNMAAINQAHTSSNRYNTEDDLMAFDSIDHERGLTRQRTIDSTRLAIKSLNVLKKLLNSSVFFTEISNHQQIVEFLSKLLMSKNSLLALLSS